MKKFFIILFLTAFSSAYAGGHLNEKDKKQLITELNKLNFNLGSLKAA